MKFTRELHKCPDCGLEFESSCGYDRCSECRAPYAKRMNKTWKKKYLAKKSAIPVLAEIFKHKQKEGTTNV